VLEAAQLTPGRQSEVTRAWLERLAAAQGQIAAGDLYQGASFARIRKVAEAQTCPLFIASAGLGLLQDTTRVPAYDLTLSPSAPSRIQSRITDPFDPASWWTQMQGGRFASSVDALHAGQGRILVALSKPYAQLIGAALAQLPPAAIQRLRIFGAGIETALPAALRAQAMPYDARLDVLVPGTRLDFASRALAHFAALVTAQPLRDAKGDARLVQTALTPVTQLVSAIRPKATDEELLKHISALVKRGLRATAALRELRVSLGIACEQGRFRRLYNQVRA
jgi:hypothetical protein